MLMNIIGIIITYIQAKIILHIGISVPKEIFKHLNRVNIISDLLKQRDTPSMERFDCGGIVKISIDKLTLLSEVELFHKDLHVRPIDKFVPEDVKEFIKNNIDLLPKEIYA